MKYDGIDDELDASDNDDDKEECGNCNGSGEADCLMEYGGPCPEQYPACGGSQKVFCNDCDGTGWQDSY
ncbi:hypothetical protein LDJ79_08045 [Vibrio tritonius]|uniref:Uncharacterized protein n=1 Tax=Vibrio tritonius TaxID=1435069 RepID=A0ABS7YK50_9VIBR|nr:hypothetical protein [Vibrio tritonius]MCA2016058.1 hypothetical protein [Vibrio tritonius]